MNRKLLGLLLDNEFTPVLTVPIIDERNAAVNSENDDIVTVLAAALAPELVVQLIEAPGLVEDKNENDPASVVARISRAELATREREATGRMKRKLLAIRRLVESGSAKVVIGDGRSETPVADMRAGKGTVAG